MLRGKLFTAFVVVVLALGGLTSSAASAAAPGWMVNGTQLTGTAALAATAAVDQEFALTAGQVEIKCGGKALIYVNPEIVATTHSINIEAAEFTECRGNAVCPLAKSAKEGIRTLPVVADITLDGALAVKGVFLAANTSKLFATTSFEGAECAFAGVQSIAGRQAFLTPTGQVESVSRLLTAVTETQGELKLASTAATFKGSALARLVSGQPFSFL